MRIKYIWVSVKEDFIKSKKCLKPSKIKLQNWKESASDDWRFEIFHYDNGNTSLTKKWRNYLNNFKNEKIEFFETNSIFYNDDYLSISFLSYFTWISIFSPVNQISSQLKYKTFANVSGKICSAKRQFFKNSFLSSLNSLI